MTSSSWVAGRRARRAPTGWPRPATTSCSSRRNASPARRRAATASRRAPCGSWRTWGWPRSWPVTTASGGCARSPSAGHSSWSGRQPRACRATGMSSPDTISTPSSPSGPSRRVPRCGRRPRPRRRSSSAASSAARSSSARTRDRSKRCAAVTWWLPMAPTPASDAPSGPSATGPTPRAWPSAGTSRRPATTSRGSSPTSTSATKRAMSCPATGGSSRWATGG